MIWCQLVDFPLNYGSKSTFDRRKKGAKTGHFDEKGQKKTPKRVGQSIFCSSSLEQVDLMHPKRKKRTKIPKTRKVGLVPKKNRPLAHLSITGDNRHNQPNFSSFWCFCALLSLNASCCTVLGATQIASANGIISKRRACKLRHFLRLRPPLPPLPPD